MRVIACFAALLALPCWAAPSLAEAEVFHGWSKDGTWLVYEVHGANELVELYFCATSADAKPSWPAQLNELDREETNGLSCARFMDPNKAPYQWKRQLVLPAAASKSAGLEVLRELVIDGENPGFVVQAGEKKQSCYASAVREDSKLSKSWVHPSGRYVAALIDGNFRHCVVTLKLALKPGPKK
jgi:hypothetical protein